MYTVSIFKLDRWVYLFIKECFVTSFIWHAIIPLLSSVPFFSVSILFKLRIRQITRTQTFATIQQLIGHNLLQIICVILGGKVEVGGIGGNRQEAGHVQTFTVHFLAVGDSLYYAPFDLRQ